MPLARSTEGREEVEAFRASADALLSQFDEVWKNGREYVARCPVHADKTPSLTIYKHRDGAWMWQCFPCGKGGDVFSLLKALGHDFPAALKRLRTMGRSVNYSAAPRPDREKYGTKGTPRGRIVATYPYHDESGRLLYEVVRLQPKDFRQRKPDGAGGWLWRLGDVRRVLYRLPQLLALSGAVYIVEGEKDADRLTRAGLIATTSCGGAGSWRPQYADQWLADRRVIILPDNDEAGRNHAADVYRSLKWIAASVRIVALPGLPPKGDVSDWLDAGNNVNDLPQE